MADLLGFYQTCATLALMRVIGGEFRSRLLKSLPGAEIRPTPDRLRETLFNILAPSVPGSVFLDAYAGTGSVGIEALSRGAERAIFIEKSPDAIALIQENLGLLGLRSRAVVHRGNAAKKLDLDQATIVFLDPPYPDTAEYGLALDALGRIARDMIVIAQHSSRLELPETAGTLHRTRTVRQGDNTLTFYRSKL
jgi:16S rRNA (guanine966-N2)-methyltransferase